MSAPAVEIHDADALARVACQRVVERLRPARRGRAPVRVALSGGSTPRPLYSLLAAQPGIEWSRIEVFFADERAVAPEDQVSNFRMVREELLSRLPGPPAAVHRIRGELPAGEAAQSYDEEVRALAREGIPCLDLVLLGLGADGHTASLFPGGPELEEKERLAVASQAPVPPRERITLTLPVLCAARRVLFLVSGREKSIAAARALRAAELGPESPPAARVRPTDGELLWLLDREAAAELEPRA